MMVVSSWSHIGSVLDAFSETGLTEVNHLIWRYSFESIQPTISRFLTTTSPTGLSPKQKELWPEISL